MLTPPTAGYALQPIGLIQSDFPDKFGVPRQPGLAPSARAILTLIAPYNDPLAVRGLETFSHLWLSFLFPHPPERWTPLVRPPRLGGNAKVGVFASRSPNRPNRLGLSLVELSAIETHGGVRLHLSGCDLVSGTPILDIKPYLPWLESRPEARAGLAPTAPPCLAVSFSASAEAVLATREDGASLRQLIHEVLAQDPRPAYRQGAETRVYGVRLRDVDVRFQARKDTQGVLLEVTEIV